MKNFKTKFLPLALASVLLLAGCSSESANSDKPNADNIDEYVTLGEYTGLSYTPVEVTVTQQDIDTEIQNVLAENTTTVEITDRGIQNGDIANIDYEGTKDGVAFEGGTAQAYDLEIGSGTFIPGFEEGLVGVKTGETVDLNLSFPEDYGSAELAGAAVVFKVTVNKITTESYPELTDEFVQEISDFNTVAEYKKDLEEKLYVEKVDGASYANKIEILGQAVANSTIIKYPQSMVDDFVNGMKAEYESYASMMGLELEPFLTSYYGMDLDTFNTTAISMAEDTIAEQLVMIAVAKAEGLEVTDENYDTTLQRYADSLYDGSVEDFVASYGEETIRDQALYDLSLDFMLENGVASTK